MARKEFAFALSMIVAASSMIASPVLAAQPEPTPGAGAPKAAADARYCLRVEPITGTRLGAIVCETRDDWAQFDVDVDKAWAEDGVSVIT